MEIEENNSNDINMFDQTINYQGQNQIKREKRGFFNFHNKSNYKSNQLTSCEIRLKKDIEELKKNQKISKYYDIILNGYKKIGDSDNFQMIIEFINHFSLKFVFTSDFPFEPPKITFFSGNQYSFLFDCNGNIILDLITKEKWSPTFWISTIIYDIEKIVYEKTSNLLFFNRPSFVNDCRAGNFYMIKRGNYNKRNWNDYLNGVNVRDSINYFKFCELKGNKFNNF